MVAAYEVDVRELQVRAAVKRQQANKYSAKVTAKAKRKQHVEQNALPHDELGDVFK